MPGLQVIERILSFAGPVAAGVLLLRLWREGLVVRYRFFALYLFWLVCELGISLSVARDKSSYFYVYVFVDSIIWIAQTLVVVELFSLVVNEYPGIAKSGRRFIWVALAAGVVVSLGVATIQESNEANPFPKLQQYLLISRVVAFILLTFLLLILGFLFYFPIPLSRNVVSYAMGYSLYFASRALTRLAGSVLGTAQLLPLSTISLAVVLGCLVFWIIFLNRRGEQVDVTVGHRWSADDARLATRHLNSINATLLKIGRK